MATFSLYHIDIQKSQVSSLYTKPVMDIELNKLEYVQGIFEACLQQPILVRKKTKDKHYTLLECSVVKRYCGITLLMLCNEKSIKYKEKMQTEELVHHPGCYVLIDNRPGHMQMAIERSSAFEGKPDNVRDYLQEAFNRLLENEQLETAILPKQSECGFWEMVERQCLTKRDTIKSISFGFPEIDDVASADEDLNLAKAYLAFNLLARALNAGKSTLLLEASKNQSLQLDRTCEDMSKLVSICCTRGYTISVRFKNYGLYRSSETIRAYCDFPDSDIQDFIHGSAELSDSPSPLYTIMLLLDHCVQSKDLYLYEEETCPCRKIAN